MILSTGHSRNSKFNTLSLILSKGHSRNSKYPTTKLDFVDRAQEQGILVKFSDKGAPWQRGATEKGGGDFKELHEKGRELCKPVRELWPE